MYIINTNGRSNIYHLAAPDDNGKFYSSACGHYTHVRRGNSRVMLVDKVSDDRRRCKRCGALVIQVRHD
jgi:hypothetical protein